jgi:hypothetical protein
MAISTPPPTLCAFYAPSSLPPGSLIGFLAVDILKYPYQISIMQLKHCFMGTLFGSAPMIDSDNIFALLSSICSVLANRNSIKNDISLLSGIFYIPASILRTLAALCQLIVTTQGARH